jgi:hypothetical protein
MGQFSWGWTGSTCWQENIHIPDGYYTLTGKHSHPWRVLHVDGKTFTSLTGTTCWREVHIDGKTLTSLMGSTCWSWSHFLEVRNWKPQKPQCNPQEGSNPDEKSLLLQYEVVHVDGKTFTSLTGSMGLRRQCRVNNIRKCVSQNSD